MRRLLPRRPQRPLPLHSPVRHNGALSLRQIVLQDRPFPKRLLSLRGESKCLALLPHGEVWLSPRHSRLRLHPRRRPDVPLPRRPTPQIVQRHLSEDRAKTQRPPRQCRAFHTQRHPRSRLRPHISRTPARFDRQCPPLQLRSHLRPHPKIERRILPRQSARDIIDRLRVVDVCFVVFDFAST